jgi:hypothetical protein
MVFQSSKLSVERQREISGAANTFSGQEACRNVHGVLENASKTAKSIFVATPRGVGKLPESVSRETPWE